jgi:hypothetical protein
MESIQNEPLTSNLPNVVMECLKCGWQDKRHQTLNCPNCDVPLASLYYDPQNRCRECLTKGPNIPQTYGVDDDTCGAFIFNVQPAIDFVNSQQYEGMALPLPEQYVLECLRVNISEPRHYPHVDTRIPVILAEVEFEIGEHLLCLIDGSHRAARLMQERKPVYGYILPRKVCGEVLT